MVLLHEPAREHTDVSARFLCARVLVVACSVTIDLLLTRLLGGLWHTTYPERFDGILKTGAILPEPVIPDADRWATSRGREHYPYVRMLGGVSLFDFNQF